MYNSGTDDYFITLERLAVKVEGMTIIVCRGAANYVVEGMTIIL